MNHLRLAIGGRQRGKVALLLPGLLLSPCASFGFETDPASVDQSAALSVEGTEISRYIVEKNYNLFAAAVRDSQHRAPDATETAEWFRVFVGQMAIKAKLARAGWLERPDIVQSVAQMSRYVLTKTDGPFYETLYDRRTIPPGQVQAALALTECSFDAFIVRFNDDETARRALGPSGSVAAFSALVAPDRSADASTDIHDGPIHWPFHPFEEMGEDLAHAVPGQAIGPLHHRLGVYYAIVRHVSKADRYGPTTPAGMARALRALDDDLVRRCHRAEILRQGRLALNRTAIETTMARLLSVPGLGDRIPPEVWAPSAGESLASYEFAGEPRRITAQDFVEDFNHRIFRRMPRTAADLIAGLQEMLVEEYDAATARKLRLDCAPKFVEDRRNFALNQVLAAYERETLLPGLHPTQADLQDYAAAHREKYFSSVESSGTLYLFADQAQAERAFIRLQQADIPYAAARAVQTIEPFVVRRDGAQLLAYLPNSALIAAAEGALFGPFTHAGQPAVFLKRISGERVEMPFAAIEPQVRRDFLRTKLDEAELTLLRENAPSLQLRLDWARYGLPASFVFGLFTQSAASPNFQSGRAPALPGVRPANLDQPTTKNKNP